MYQNGITATKPGTSIKTFGRETGKKEQITARMKITRRNVMIENGQSPRKGLLQEEEGGKIICKRRHIIRSLQRTIYCQNIKPRALQ